MNLKIAGEGKSSERKRLEGKDQGGRIPETGYDVVSFMVALAVAAFALCGIQQAKAATACTSGRFNDTNDLGRCQLALTPQKGACPDCGGMPRWWVTEPYISLDIADEPLSYFTSSGQKMAFVWTHRNRARLPDVWYNRLFDEVSQRVMVRMDERFFSSGTSQYRILTNAVWCHNWWSEIVFWDPYLESNSTAPSGPSVDQPAPNTTRAWFPMSLSYKGFILFGDGSTVGFDQSASSSAASSLKLRVQFLGPTSANYGPELPVAFDTATNTVSPYPTNGAGIVWVSNAQYGFKVIYPDGSQDIYGFVFLDNPGTSGPRTAYRSLQGYTPNNTSRAFLTARVDPQGRTSLVGYMKQVAVGQPNYLVRYVVDPDGRTNTYSYNPSDSHQLQQIQDPYGRTATFGYSSSAMLTSIRDAAQNTSTLQYSAPQLTVSGSPPNQIYSYVYDGWVTNLNTPYGTTTFTYFDQPDSGFTGTEYVQRSVLVGEPNGAYQLYLYQHNNSAEPGSLNSGVPSVNGWTFDNGAATSPSDPHPGLNYRNTYHWGRRQFASLSVGLAMSLHPAQLGYYLSQLSSVDFYKAHLNHWLVDPSDQFSVTDWISSEREPSRDTNGLTVEPRTWYAYVGQPSGSYDASGTEPLIGCIAKVLPDGTTQYEIREHDSFGNLTRLRESYSKPGAGLGERTNTFNYSTNGVDLVAVTNSAGQWATAGYNGNHEPTFLTNALGQVTTLKWDSTTQNLTSLSSPDGLAVNLSYEPAGYWDWDTNCECDLFYPYADAGVLKTVSFPATGRSLTLSYSNGTSFSSLPLTVQDDRGLKVTNTWDGLNRLTSRRFPDGTTVSNVYDRLYLGRTKDRLGNWTGYGYDGLEHVTSITNALTNVTTLSWCGCGALNSITDPLTNTTLFFYNNQGLLTNQVFADTSSITYSYDSVQRLTQVVDGAGHSLTAGYNNQGLVTSVNNLYGPLWQALYDAADRPIQVTDANGVTITNQFDLLNRLTERTWLADGISEGFGWTTNGLVAYTNRDGKVTSYARDAAGRVTAVTNANLGVTQFGYNSLDEITSLIDARTNSRSWAYNEYGWLTNKGDALNPSVLRLSYNPSGWVTNRWTPQSGNTTYGFDALGNLKSITYPSSGNPSIQFAYDALNQLTNMVDATGTTAFSYTRTGELQGENGPWPSDTLTYGYTQGQRTSLSLSTALLPVNWAYDYDAGFRLQTLDSPAGTFRYSYANASALVRGASLPNQASVTNHYDYLARLDYTKLLNQWGHNLDGYSYIHDPLGLRTNIFRDFGLANSSVSLGYDNAGQLVSWSAHEPNGSLRLNEQLGFGFDPAGNLHYRTNGSLIQTFTSDSGNQLGSITRNATMTVSGATPGPANVTVNGTQAQTNLDFTFASGNQPVSNGNSTFTVVAQRPGDGTVTNALNLVLPASLTLLYDANGNLTNDGARNFLYDAENRLTNIFVVNLWKSEFVFDGLGRRRVERIYAWVGGQWFGTYERRFVYDGWLPIQERDSNNAVQVTYTRGLDLSGSLAGAGGIGGFLARTDGTGDSTFYHADGAGNITAIIDGQQNIVARYLMDPFGRPVGQWGPLALANDVRFSSMLTHRASGLSLFAFRAYDPALGRFTSRDPIGERGGVNLYRFAGNAPLSFVDPYGLSVSDFLYGSGPSLPEMLGGLRDRLANEMNQVGQGLYDMAMGDAHGPADPNMKGALDAQEGLVDIDRNDNVLRDSMGEAGALGAEAAELAGELYLGGKLSELAEGLRGCPLPTAAKSVPLRSNADLVQEAATRAENAIGGTGRFAGTDKHTYAKRLLDKYQGIYGDRGLRTETTWLNHNQVSYGTKGAPRIDVHDVNANWAYDYKFTLNPPALKPAQTQRILNHGPRGLGGVTEVNP
jgi:RHS repeat-associated protein